MAIDGELHESHQTPAASSDVAVSKNAAASAGGKVTGRLADDEPWRACLRGDTRWEGPRGDWYFTSLRGRPTAPLTSLPTPRLDTVTREEALAYFENGWELTEALFSSLACEEAFYRQPNPLRHPLIFYFAHAAVVFINKLNVAGVLKAPLDKHYEVDLFEVGVDEMLWDDLGKNATNWPALIDVVEYRRRAHDTIVDAIRTHPGFDAPEGVHWGSPLWALFLGCEHERIHLETSSVLIRESPIEYLQMPVGMPAYHPSVAEPSAHPPVAGRDYPVNELVDVAGGSVRLGKPEQWPTFNFDVEYGDRTYDVEPYAVGKFMVSNGEFWQFVSSGGYHDSKFWTKDGWAWRTYRNAKWPVYWVSDGPGGLHKYKLRLPFSVVDMPWSWPVDVNHYEAEAFLNYKSHLDGIQCNRPYRLMTEPENVNVRNDVVDWDKCDPTADPACVADGSRMAEEFGQNCNCAFSSHSPVDAMKPTSKGVHDVMGNAWDMIDGHLCALPGFKVHPVYDDFSSPCFDGLHWSLQGGSFMSTGSLASHFARYGFRAYFFQHMGFRLARSAADAQGIPLRACMDGPGPHATETGAPCCTAVVRRPMADAWHSDDFVRLAIEAVVARDSELVLPPAIRALPGVRDALHPYKAVVAAAQAALASAGVSADALAGKRALDLGCGIGAGTFELARHFAAVTGIDGSAKQIAAGKTALVSGSYLGKQGAIDASIDRSRVNFATCDVFASIGSCSSRFGKHDVIFLVDVLDFLSEPAELLAGLDSLLADDGVVVVATAYAHDTMHSDADKWLHSMGDVHKALGSAYSLLATSEVLAVRPGAGRTALLASLETAVFQKQ